MSDTSPLFVASDVHGHYDAFAEALRVRGLVDEDAKWTGGDARLWVLGDLFDRGQEGVAVLRLLRRLAGQAAAEGGVADTLLGNHEVLVLGSKRFGGHRFTDADGQERHFLHWWVLNGGFEDELADLTDDEVAWLQSRRVVHLVHRSLLVHADSESYLGYGRTEEAVNTAVRAVFASEEPEEWWRLFRELTRRHEFTGEDGPERVRSMLRAFGGEELIHGHSTIPDTTDLEPAQVTQARRYCDGLALNVDGGVYQGGKCLVVRLNLFAAPSLGRQVVDVRDRRGSGVARGPRLHPQAHGDRDGQSDEHPADEGRVGDGVSERRGRRRGERGAAERREERAPVRREESTVSHIRHNDPYL